VYEVYNPQFNISNHIEEFTININQAVSLGLLLNELITNSFKHAFDDVDQAVISIDFYEEDGFIEVVYQDNGKGLVEFTFKDEDSLGMVLISTLLTQLSAEYQVLDGPGFGIRFKFQAVNQGAHSSLS
jgi:two-component sensor histidine kinase